MPWRKGMTSGCSTSWTYLLLLRLPSIRSKLDSLLYEITHHTITLGVWPLCNSITHSGRQCCPVQHITWTRPSWSHKLKRNSSKKITWRQSVCQALCSWAHFRRTRWWFAVRGGSFIKAPLHSVYGAADVNELTKVTLARLQQYINVLATAWRKLYSHSPPCGACKGSRALTSPSVVHCQFFVFFGAHRSTASKVAALWTVPLHTSCCCAIKKIFLLEGR